VEAREGHDGQAASSYDASVASLRVPRPRTPAGAPLRLTTRGCSGVEGVARSGPRRRFASLSSRDEIPERRLRWSLCLSPCPSTCGTSIHSVKAKELLTEAWKAVEESGVPEPLHALAFQEAIDLLKSERKGSDSGNRPKRDRSQRSPRHEETPDGGRDEDTFFADLASESGESEQDLRDVLHLTNDGKVQVTAPTKDLGSNLSEQAKTTIALVASARARGLPEKPVKAQAVRDELDRKHCYDSGNFSAQHLGKLKGFNAGSDRSEIVLTSKWVDEFRDALAKVHGRPATGIDN
jgi:hypothetical protein